MTQMFFSPPLPGFSFFLFPVSHDVVTLMFRVKRGMGYGIQGIEYRVQV